MTIARCDCGDLYWARNVAWPNPRCYTCDKEYQNAARAGRVIVNGFNWRHSYVYFAHSPATELIKIGASNKPEERIHALRITHKDPTITYIGFIPAEQKSENLLHKRFKSIRVRGEWFRPDPCLTSYILRSAYVLAYIRAAYQIAWAAAKYQYYLDYGTTNSYIAEPESITPGRKSFVGAFNDTIFLSSGVLPTALTHAAAPAIPSDDEMRKAA